MEDENILWETNNNTKPSELIKNLSSDEELMVNNFLTNMNIEVPNFILQYGANTQKNLSKASENLLTMAKSNYSSEINGALEKLVKEISSFDNKVDDTGVFSKIFGASKKISNKSISEYVKTEKNLTDIEKDLEKSKRSLLKDVSMYETMYDINYKNFRELTMYIAAGDRKIEQLKATDLKILENKVLTTNDDLEKQKLNDMLNFIERFEQKLYDLKLSRTISMQMAPQIRLLQSSNLTLLDKIQSSLNNSIPIWKNQMAILLGLTKSIDILQGQQKFDEATNKGMLKTSEALKEAEKEFAIEIENNKKIASSETIKQANEEFLNTIDNIKNTMEKTENKRTAAENQLNILEKKVMGKL